MKKQDFWEIRCTDIKNICQYKKIKENHRSDIKRICQHQAKMNADVKILCQDQKKWNKKHEIEATDVKNTRQRPKKTSSERLKLFIADVKLIRQWYQKVDKSRQKIENSWIDVRFLRQHWRFFSHLACTDVKNYVSKRNSLQWRRNHTSALGKRQRL